MTGETGIIALEAFRASKTELSSVIAVAEVTGRETATGLWHGRLGRGESGPFI